MALATHAMHVVNTPSGAVHVRCWESSSSEATTMALTVVTVHPWATLGGGEHNCLGIAKLLAAKGVRTLTFDLHASSMVWGVLTNHRKELAQITAVCSWAADQFGGDVALFGSSAGAPMAGAVLPKLDVISRFVAVGYTFGWLSSIVFVTHPKGRLHGWKAGSTTPSMTVVASGL